MAPARTDEGILGTARRLGRLAVGTPTPVGPRRIPPGVVWIGYMPACFTGFSERAGHGFDQSAGNFGEKARWKRGAQTLFTIGASVDGARETQRLLCTRHSDVKQAALFFDVGSLIDRAAVRQDALFEPGEKNRIEFQAFSAVQGHQGNRDRLVILVGISYQRGAV